MDWGTVLASSGASAVISAVVTGFVARRNSERTIQIENITKERAKWRDKIRELAARVQKASMSKGDTTFQSELAETRLLFTLNSNPFESEDREILGVIAKLADWKDAPDKLLLEFADRVALLLKHDWERAKAEAAHEGEPRRVLYDEFCKLGMKWSSADTNASAKTKK